MTKHAVEVFSGERERFKHMQRMEENYAKAMLKNNKYAMPNLAQVTIYLHSEQNLKWRVFCELFELIRIVHEK